jgi:transcriptional regulator with XRE-family HTH domain
MPISEKDQRVGRSIYRVQKMIANALLEAKATAGLSQQAVAQKLGVDRSVINRRVTGRANLTLQSLAELAWALDRELVVDFARRESALEARRPSAKIARALSQWTSAFVEPTKPVPPAISDAEAAQLLARVRSESARFSFSAAGNDNPWLEEGELETRQAA